MEEGGGGGGGRRGVLKGFVNAVVNRFAGEEDALAGGWPDGAEEVEETMEGEEKEEEEEEYALVEDVELVG